ncbi:C/D box methylation guide ribonucleoprotein complex aNOP56 subunit [Candidatus Thorarchaeota archaeon]|nr:MAG: C/D box methylation guide ribonucleoprotein complex aNOP56 subunit [Candidatus Thorarchaeota archaeon]
MPVYLALSAFGVFVLDDRNRVIAKHVFYPDVERAVSNLLSISENESAPMISAVLEEIRKVGEKDVVVEDQMLARALSKDKDVTVKIESNRVAKWFRENQKEYLTQLGIIRSPEDIPSYRYNVALRLSKSKISAASEEKDLLVKNAIDAIDEIDKSINVLVMRLREWYSVHHPSLSTIVQDQDQFAKILRVATGKDNMSRELLENAEVPSEIIGQIFDALPGDIGGELREIDLSIISNLASAIDTLYKSRKRLEEYVAEVMEVVAPNVTALVGPLIGARLISLAGSLKDLSRKPSSTVQVFGAEKALFRSLKTGADPPKHGIIYRVPEVHNSAYWQRGKIARALAGKLSIAARIDAYSDRNDGEMLREGFLARVEEIKRQNPEQPPIKPVKSEDKKKLQRKEFDRKGRDKRKGNHQKRSGRR